MQIHLRAHVSWVRQNAPAKFSVNRILGCYLSRRLGGILGRGRIDSRVQRFAQSYCMFEPYQIFHLKHKRKLMQITPTERTLRKLVQL